ncbi:glycosyltransferase [Clostridiaceae bacterium HFYG-1003]|nr:glycosyltransferase [Clostridiaceae bacterium HFYG-1003]
MARKEKIDWQVMRIDEGDKKMMLVTIISVAFNSEKTIAKTIESVLNQTYENIEYIIVDGVSKDNTVKVVSEFQHLFDAKKGRSLKIISEPDKGMYDALNKGARMAHGELIGQINTDDWYESDAVENMVKLYVKEKYNVAWGSIRMCGKKTWIKHAKIGKLWTTAGWCHPGMFSRKETLLEFPYALESMYDDFDYITAVHQAGRKIVTIDKIVSNFAFGDGGMSTKKSLKEVKKRVDITYGIYQKYGMSKFYWCYRWAFELVKYVVG